MAVVMYVLSLLLSASVWKQCGVRQHSAQIQLIKSLLFRLLALVIVSGDPDWSINSIRCRCIFIGVKLLPHLPALDRHDRVDCKQQFLESKSADEGWNRPLVFTLAISNQKAFFFFRSKPQRQHQQRRRLKDLNILKTEFARTNLIWPTVLDWNTWAF